MFRRLLRCSLIPARRLSSTELTAGKTSLALFNIPMPAIGADPSPETLIIDAYRARVLHEYQFLEKISPKQPDPGTYSQLPDDSQFIEQHYQELRLFRTYLADKHHKSFSDCSSRELLDALYQFIDELLQDSAVVVDKHITQDSAPDITVDNIFIKLQGEHISIKHFLRFLVDVKITLNLNSNHTFVLDALLYNKEVFDQVDTTITNKRKKNK